jgi:hypothetical protein
MGWVQPKIVATLPVFAQGLGLPYPGWDKPCPYDDITIHTAEYTFGFSQEDMSRKLTVRQSRSVTFGFGSWHEEADMRPHTFLQGGRRAFYTPA